MLFVNTSTTHGKKKKNPKNVKSYFSDPKINEKSFKEDFYIKQFKCTITCSFSLYD